MALTPDEYERQFRRAGLPLLIEGYSARRDVFTPARPILLMVVLGELLGALNFEWSTLANIAAVIGGAAIVVAGFVAANLLRGRRALAVPQTVGRIEVAGFVLLPAALPLIFGGQVTSALVTALANIVLLAAVHLVVGYAVLWILLWVVRRLAGQLARSLFLLARAIPLLLLFGVVLFLTTETWQTFGGLDDARLAAFAVLLFGIEWVFLAARLPREIAALERETSTGPPLQPRQRLNLGMVMFVSQTVQAAVVTTAVGVFFTLLGLIVITPELLGAWIESSGDELVGATVLGVDVRLTAELVRVSIALAGLSSLYYSIAMLTDATYRKEFLEEIIGELRATFTARAEYLAVLTARG